MPKYLAKAAFTPQGIAALRASGANGRAEAAATLAAHMGGALEAYYFAFGDYDVYAIFDLPDDEAAAAAAFATNAGGSGRVEVTKLLTPAQIDEAFTRSLPQPGS
jgi:uncharacterized protein with GYD domain